MLNEKVIITSPNLNPEYNVSGISSVTNFIVNNNTSFKYMHFELGKRDAEKRDLIWFVRILRAWFSWFFILVREKNVFIHFNFALDKRSIIRDAPLILFAKLIRKRMLIHLHGGEFLGKANVPKILEKLLVIIFSGNEPKIVLSSIEERILINKYNANNVFVLPNCIDYSKAKDFFRQYPSESPVKLLFMGRIVIRKGLEYILEALSALKRENIKFKFFLAGTGPDKENYVKKFAEHLGDAFEYVGIASGEFKYKLLRECDIFLLPSLFGEGLPITLLESMSFSLVPLVTNDGSMSFIVRNMENGIILDKESSTSIANAIIYLVNDKTLLQRLGIKARESIFENFSPLDYINKINNIYSKC